MNIDDFKRNILGGGDDLDEETIDVLNLLIQIQTVNNGCNFCKKETEKDKVRQFDGLFVCLVLFLK